MPYKVGRKRAFAFLVMLISFMSGYPVFYGSVGSLTWYLFYYGKYLLSLLFIAYAFYECKIDKCTAYLQKKFNIIFLVYSGALLAYSVLIWILESPSFDFITRGISNTLFNGLSFATGIAIACSLKKDAPKYGLLAALTTYCISIVLGLLHDGGYFIKNCLFFRSTSAQGAYTELHEVAFVIGLYLIFLIFINKNKFIKKTRYMMALCVIFFIIAWKRIGIGAFLLVAVYLWIIQRKVKPLTPKLMKITEIVTIVVCFVYVAFSTSDDLITIFRSHGIEMSGRNIIYSYFRKFCDFTPLFFGHGVGFVSRQFDYTTAADLHNMVSIKALHNDFMKMYIDVGFIGFLVWCYFWLFYLPKKVKMFANVEAGFYALCLILFAFVTYTTDNTAGYYSFQMHLVMLIFVISHYYRNDRQVRKTNE